MSNESRSRALRKLAQAHEIHRGDRNSSGEDYGAYLDNPDSICEWVAVTRSPEAGITYLRADFPDRLSAKRYAARHIGDDLFEELPVEVVNLDSGQSISSVLSVRWDEVGEENARGRGG
jgi:hypothetical protein